MQKHLYSKDPVQAAHTGGIFWLFENAVVKDIQITSENKSSLNFAGNRQWISSRVSIPTASAWITFAGCLAVSVIAILVSEWAKEEETRPVILLAPQQVAATMVNPSQYPPLLVRTRVDKVLEAETPSASCNTGQDIHEFEISEITIRHRTDLTTQVIAVNDRETINTDQGSPAKQYLYDQTSNPTTLKVVAPYLLPFNLWTITRRLGSGSCAAWGTNP